MKQDQRLLIGNTNKRKSYCHNSVFFFHVFLYSLTVSLYTAWLCTKGQVRILHHLILSLFFHPALFWNINTEYNCKPFLILKHCSICWSVLTILNLSFLSFIISLQFLFIYKKRFPNPYNNVCCCFLFKNKLIHSALAILRIAPLFFYMAIVTLHIYIPSLTLKHSTS